MVEKNIKIEGRLKTLPKSAGVYLMKDLEGEILYIGKAKDLSKRVKSYFNRQLEDVKTLRLVERIDDLEWMVTDNELEALMLETNLIKKYRPRYNILMKDDKNYVYIKITNEEYPRLLITRKVIKDGAKYFGPYTNGLKVNKVIRSLNRIFPFFTYQNESGMAPMNSVAGKELFYKRAKSVWGDLADSRVYLKMIDDLVKFLKGDSTNVIKMFKAEMLKASEKKDFESAGILRDRINDIETIVQNQKIVTPKKEDVDVVGYYGKHKNWVVCVMTIREGKLLDIRYVTMRSKKKNDFDEVLSRFVVDFFEDTVDLPRKIYLPENILQKFLLEKYLENKFDKKIQILVPQKGEKSKLVGMAGKNAKIEYLRQRSLIGFARNESLGLIELLKSVHKIGWKEYEVYEKWKRKKSDCFRIEGYDISNLGDNGVVGAMVSWKIQNPKLKMQNNKSKVGDIVEGNNLKVEKGMVESIGDLKGWKGGFDKKMYRRFEIKSFRGQDDFAAMSEVLSRRFARREGGWVWPDLVLIDGGKGQLGVVLGALRQIGADVPVISLAKQEEEIWLGKFTKIINEKLKIKNGDGITFMQLKLDKDSPGNLLLQGIRDEVHRFVLSYQRIVRKKEVRKSVLDQVEGLGPKKKRLLLDKFGSVKGIVEAGEEEIAKVAGVKLAKKLFEIL